ncbi:MAG: serine hydrolase domain-containing protein [Fulvivirga sp.]
MNKFILLLLIITILAACETKTKSTSDSDFKVNSLKDSLSTELKQLQQTGQINGFGVAIVNDGGVLFQNGFGLADVKLGKPYTTNTLQNIASISKTFIGVALLKAQEMGKLNLDDSVGKYLPFDVYNPYYPDKVITVRHLATHTSTILDADLYGEKAYLLLNTDDHDLAKSLPSSAEFNLPDLTVDMGTFLKNFLSMDGEWYGKESFLNKKPGEMYEYSNVGATLAAYIIELATNQSYDEFTTQHILGPLNMSASGWAFDSIDPTKHTKLYTVKGEEIPYYSLITYPDGGLITSINDMAIYLCELIKGYSGQGELLSKTSYDRIFAALLSEKNFEERDTDRPFDDEYNAGIFMGHTPIGYLGHIGGDPGVSTFLFFNPQTRIGKLLFVNTDLDANGAKQFYAIWDKLGEYETKLAKATISSNL